MEPNQETSESQLPSRRLVRKTPRSGVDEKHPDSQIEHVGQTPIDAPSQPTVELETTSFFPALGPVSKPTTLWDYWTTCKTATYRRGCIHNHCQCQFRPSQVVSSLHKESRLNWTCWFVMTRAFVPLSLEKSALAPKERIVPSRMVLVEKCDDGFVKARLTARRSGTQQTSAPTVSTNSKVVTLQVMASLGADVELGDVTGALLESAELNRQGGKLFLRQPSGGLPGLHPQQLLEIRLPLCGWYDCPKKWFLEVSNFHRNIGWKSSALDECVLTFFDLESKVLARILCLHEDDLLLGGCGTAFRTTVHALRSRFPFRKWQRNQG